MEIWLSKVDVVNEATEFFKSKYQIYCWIDISLARMKYKRACWDFTKVNLSKNRINHYYNNMRLDKKLLPINASYLSGSKEVWNKLANIYDEIISTSNRKRKFEYDEEIILYEALVKKTNLFKVINGNIFTRIFRYFFDYLLILHNLIGLILKKY